MVKQQPAHKRSQVFEDAGSAGAVKRSRLYRNAKASSEYKRLKHVTFPPAMVALPHVMDLIDTLLMTPQEALLEAATTDDGSWVYDLLNAYRDIQRPPLYLTDALVAAASRGCMGSFDILLWEGIAAYHGPLYDLPEAIRDTVVKATVGAAENGHLDIVEYVVKEVVDGDENDDSGRIVPPWSDIHLALEGAASNGHLDVVKLLTNHARDNVEGHTMHSWSSSDALTCAILGQHGEVVEYLMTLVDEFRWNMTLAFEAAVRGDQHVLAERIYERYPSTVQGENLFVALARDGGTHAIKYLYDNGRDDLDLLNGAFLVAAENGSTGVINFLLETGRISSEIFDEAFVAASGSVLRAKTVSFLYEKKRATSEAINKVFASTHSFAVTKLLYENEVIPREAIIAVFRKAALYGIGHFFRLTKDKLDTVRLLCELDCIPAEVIGKAYSDAATTHLTQIMELLRDHRKLSREARESAFANAASAGYPDLVRTMYDVNLITPDALLTAFLTTRISETKAIVETLAAFMCKKEHVPQAIRAEAFVAAAKKGLNTS